MNLKSVNEIIPKIKVILRLDLDLPFLENTILDNSRLLKSISTIRLLLEKECKILILGHRGRPQGIDENFSLRSVYLELMLLLEPNGENTIESVFLSNINFEQIDQALATNQIVFVENIRFWPQEESNDLQFLTPLSLICQAYVNDAFAVAHRSHASITLWQKMPSFYGLSFLEEYSHLEALTNPTRPLTIVLGGAKEDKLKYLPKLEKIADYILIGGKLPRLNNGQQIESSKIIWAKLREDGLDLSDEDIPKFKEIINGSKTIIWAGAMGRYEDENCKKGTEEIARSIAQTQGYKIIAGGDTGASIINLGLKDKIDFICSGGGVMLEFLVKGTLPAWSE